jgi:hypothetical protein
MKYLWCNPDMPHYQRLLLGVVYLPMLFWWWLVGNPIILLNRDAVQHGYAADEPSGLILHSCCCPRCGLTYSEPFQPSAHR